MKSLVLRGWGLVIVALLSSAPFCAAQDDRLCLACHNDPENDMVFDTNALPHSAHAEIACIDCHADLEGLKEDHGDVKRVDCSGCHEDEVTAYRQSEHGKAVGDGVTEAASCADCHGKPHGMLSSAVSNAPSHYSQIPRTCGECHGKLEIMARYTTRRGNAVFDYSNSVHGLVLAHEGKHAAVCTDCHGEHAIHRGTAPASTMFWQRIPQTCGACHEEISTKYALSVHGVAVAEGKREAPVCTDCHGEHTIAAVEKFRSSVGSAHISETCGQCHGAERISTRYSLPGGVFDSYMRSFHGLASQIGGVAAANCASCHGYHGILPSTDPASSINAANLPTTCGKCHPKIGTRVGTEDYRVHAPPGAAPGKPVIVNIVATTYIIVIILVVGGMIAFNLLDYTAKARTHIRAVRADPDAELRLTPWLRAQHALLVITFIILAYSGFVHKYPNGWWSWPFQMIDDGSYWRGLTHRIAGWIFTALFAFHLMALFGTARGRAYLLHLKPLAHDVTDTLLCVGRNLGYRKETLPHRRFNFAEKAEYWALVWGSVVMIVTGIMLIFTSETLRLLPQIWLEVAQVVHYYEAVLATLAIVVWHFYWVIFDPHEYPMNPAWMIGKKPAHHAWKDEEET
ncbi:MAG: cytochrome b/b6 domain-containing protein [bacterium]